MFEITKRTLAPTPNSNLFAQLNTNDRFDISTSSKNFVYNILKKHILR